MAAPARLGLPITTVPATARAIFAVPAPLPRFIGVDEGIGRTGRHAREAGLL